MKFCINCEHCVAKQISNYVDHVCKIGVIDLVTGQTNEIYAWDMRRNGRCGTEGKLFKRKGEDRYCTDIPELT